MITWGDKSKPDEENSPKGTEVLVKEPEILETVDNRIYFYAEVTRQNVLRLNKNLREKSNQYVSDAQIRETDGTVPIYLHVNSYGGSIFAGLSCMDEILRCKVPVYTVVDGCAASAATLLTIVGRKRFIKPNSFMMIHQLWAWMFGKYTEFQDEMVNLDVLMEKIIAVYLDHTKVSEDELRVILDPKVGKKGVLDHDLWWDAETSLKYGLVDEITP